VNGRKWRRKTIVGTLEQYPTRVAAERACEHLRLAANAETLVPECPTIRGLIDRYIEQVLQPCLDLPVGGEQDTSARISFQCAKSYKSVLDKWVRPHWESHRVCDFDHPAVRSAIEELATFLVALATKPEGPCAENRTLHLKRTEAYFQVRGEVGLSPREPDGRKTRRVTAWLYKTLKTACTTDGGWFLFSVGPAWTARR